MSIINNKYKQFTKSYLSLRKTIGWIGILLPFVLLIGGFCFKPVVQPSISDYYYTNMRNIFVGSLCSVAVFLFFYCGYDYVDNLAGDIAGVFALGTAFFPTNMNGVNPDIFSRLHLICAALLFVTLSFFSIFLFTRRSELQPLWIFSRHNRNRVEKNKQKRKRNVIYYTCGVLMLLGIIGTVVLISTTTKEFREKYSIIFFIEAFMLIVFGLSWLTKGGDFIFPDKKRIDNPRGKYRSKKRKIKARFC